MTVRSERLLGSHLTACKQPGLVATIVLAPARSLCGMMVEGMPAVIAASPAWYGCTAGAQGHAARARTRA
eukprot:12870273-Alexandrium_andersonii.AAC.1